MRQKQPLDRAGRVAIAMNCHRCSSPLLGQVADGACPSCGESIARALGRAFSRVDELDALRIDISCARCAYNLRHQAINGACPECGLSVARSAFVFALHESPIEWLRTLRRGALVTSVAFAVFMVAPLLGLLSSLVPLYQFGLGFGSWIDEFVIYSWIIAVALLTTVGLTVFTRRDPSESGPEASRWRPRTRVWLLVTVALMLLLTLDEWLSLSLVLDEFLYQNLLGHKSLWPGTGTLIAIGFYAAGAFTLFCAHLHAAAVLRRVPARKRVWLAKGLAALTAFTALAFIVGTVGLWALYSNVIFPAAGATTAPASMPSSTDPNDVFGSQEGDTIANAKDAPDSSDAAVLVLEPTVGADDNSGAELGPQDPNSTNAATSAPSAMPPWASSPGVRIAMFVLGVMTFCGTVGAAALPIVMAAHLFLLNRTLRAVFGLAQTSSNYQSAAPAPSNENK